MGPQQPTTSDEQATAPLLNGMPLATYRFLMKLQVQQRCPAGSTATAHARPDLSSRYRLWPGLYTTHDADRTRQDPAAEASTTPSSRHPRNREAHIPHVHVHVHVLIDV